ncbi:MAG: histidinol-phosphatase [Melioribacteraceae bacterium]|nr:histidinol-phosphatase [Melioribacteraceae bacterium]MCF8355076.1 histidinol-phosphatase [Melioribacteraceae bacterium]MCF8395669.1 histidinol-phosphatase [Melioribacteraceae bacterium]MCF8420294.1 histidinol-phosphatase [Melioribacteraceae bacterium]
MSEIRELKKFCEELANESGRIITKYFRSNVDVKTKADNSPVTIADRSAEDKMREMIMREFPSHGIIGEEFGNYNENAEYVWILDPIDGTKSFICGAVTFGTLIAVAKKGQPVIGVFNQPVLGELLIGDNYTTELNDQIVQVRDCSSLHNAVLLTTDHLLIEQYQNLPKFEQLMRKVKLYRQWGDCYGYYLVSTGYADIMIDPVMSVWDSMALIPIINGAGGKITDYHGNDPVIGSSIIASVPGLHDQVIDLLN